MLGTILFVFCAYDWQFVYVTRCYRDSNLLGRYPILVLSLYSPNKNPPRRITSFNKNQTFVKVISYNATTKFNKIFREHFTLILLLSIHNNKIGLEKLKSTSNTGFSVPKRLPDFLCENERLWREHYTDTPCEPWNWSVCLPGENIRKFSGTILWSSVDAIKARLCYL